MAGKRYKHPDTLQDRRPQRVRPPLDLIAPGTDRLGDDLVRVPAAPTGLSAKAKRYWAELHQGPIAHVLIQTDGFALVRYIWSVDQWLRVTADLERLRRELLPAGRRPASTGRTSILQRLEELQEAQARGLIDDGDFERTKDSLLDAWVEAGKGAPPTVVFYALTWRLRQALRQHELDLVRHEQAFGLNPLARMRLNVAATDAISGIEELNRQLDGGPVSATAEPEWVDAE
jgi:hypothetical protein